MVGGTRLMTCKTQIDSVKTTESVLKEMANSSEQEVIMVKYGDDELGFEKSTFHALNNDYGLEYNHELDVKYREYVENHSQVRGFWGNYNEDMQGFVDTIKSVDDSFEEITGFNSYNGDSRLNQVIDAHVWSDKDGYHCLMAVHQGGDVRGNYSEYHVFDLNEELDTFAGLEYITLSCECGLIYSDDGYSFQCDEYYQGPQYRVDEEIILDKRGLIPSWDFIPSELDEDKGKLVCKHCKNVVISSE